ncbi:hypothetical protein QL285_025379 [Trifolium repens]|nr:hypothetical protein QL285_025379 [Trifolium repens]
MLEEALNRQEMFWQEKAKINWHLNGDRNTKYFHRLVKIKNTTKTITSLQDGDNILTDYNQISDHIINYYKNLFCSNLVLQDSTLIDDVIPSLVTTDVNAILTLLPSHEEIKAAVFALNTDSAPGPDGFGAFFYQHYWEIVQQDVTNAVLEFFTKSWILPGFNANIIALIPKSPEATSIDQYRPIAMANFKFKVISKILADRLASILPSIISDEQKGFIHDRNIQDCICIASEAVNLLHNKSFGEVLSRSISKLVNQGVLNQIKGTRNCWVPSHSFYADDLLIFCKGNLSGLKALKNLFDQYALESGQVINPSKSTIYSGSITPGRLNLIVQLLNFKLGSIPFVYLGVPIFKGKPTSLHLQPVADKIKLKLSAWKASLLSIAGRVQLVRSVVQSMLIYSISIYSWPTSLIKDLEKCIRNFIWSGDTDKRKLVTVSWKIVCRPFSQGGLNIRSLVKLNEASNLKLCWSLLHSHASWAKLLRDRVFKKGRPINHHIFSSLWSSVKAEFVTIKDNSAWLFGDGVSISFWHDEWCGPPLSTQLHIPTQISSLLSSKALHRHIMLRFVEL